MCNRAEKTDLQIMPKQPVVRMMRLLHVEARSSNDKGKRGYLASCTSRRMGYA